MSGSATRRPAATSSTTRRTAPSSCRPSRPWWSPTRTARSSSAAPSRAIASCYADHDILVDAFRTGAGVGWQEHDDRLFSGVLRLFRPGYAAHLVDEWLPALDGVVEKLRAGASVADVGCGLGASTIIMAQAFERSTFVGFDIHEPSIDAARKAAAEAGVDQRARFDVATAKELPRHRL